MSKKHFQSLFESLEILNKEDHAPVDVEDLDNYEKQTGFQLPQSYRDFILSIFDHLPRGRLIHSNS